MARGEEVEERDARQEGERARSRSRRAEEHRHADRGERREEAEHHDAPQHRSDVRPDPHHQEIGERVEEHRERGDEDRAEEALRTARRKRRGREPALLRRRSRGVREALDGRLLGVAPGARIVRSAASSTRAAKRARSTVCAGRATGRLRGAHRSAPPPAVSMREARPPRGDLRGRQAPRASRQAASDATMMLTVTPARWAAALRVVAAAPVLASRSCVVATPCRGMLRLHGGARAQIDAGPRDLDR